MLTAVEFLIGNDMWDRIAFLLFLSWSNADTYFASVEAVSGGCVSMWKLLQRST